MTNGEKFKQIFSITQVDEGELYAFAWLPNHDAAEFSIDWWNANYSEIPTGSTTKNDLGVECISRQSVLDKIQRLINAEQNNIDENGDYMNYARERVNAYEAIQFFVENDYLCPSVTPQEPKIVSIVEIKYDKDKLKELMNKAVLTVTPQEPKTGHWIEHEHNGITHIECSECSSWFLRPHLIRNRYCPNCGAKMTETEG